MRFRNRCSHKANNGKFMLLQTFTCDVWPFRLTRWQCGVLLCDCTLISAFCKTLGQDLFTDSFSGYYKYHIELLLRSSALQWLVLVDWMPPHTCVVYVSPRDGSYFNENALCSHASHYHPERQSEVEKRERRIAGWICKIKCQNGSCSLGANVPEKWFSCCAKGAHDSV